MELAEDAGRQVLGIIMFTEAEGRITQSVQMNPSWVEIEAAIRTLQDYRKAGLYVSFEEGDYFGKGYFKLSVSAKEGAYYIGSVLPGDHAPVHLCGPGRDNFEPRPFKRIGEVIGIVRYFAETAKRDPRFEWFEPA